VLIFIDGPWGRDLKVRRERGYFVGRVVIGGSIGVSEGRSKGER
jgi:hypothetical protein